MASTCIEQAKEELKKFNDISIEPIAHKYSDSLGTKYTSVTTFVHKFTIPFEKHKMALKCALRDARPINEVLDEWEQKGAYARCLGTEVHAVMEHLWKQDENKPDYDAMSKFPGMIEDFEYRKGICVDLYEKMKNVYEPIANEVIVNDPALGLSGTIDFVAYNKKTDTVDILDWKTSKQFSISSGSTMMKDPFGSFPNTNVSEYSLQLSLYKYIVEKHTGLKINELRLFQIPGKGKMKTIKCYDMVDLLKTKLFNAEALSNGEILEFSQK